MSTSSSSSRATPISFADKPTLTGDLVVLRPVTAAYTADVMDSLANAETMRLTGTHRRFTTEQVRQVLAARTDQDDRLDLVVIERATGRYAGEAVLNNLDADNLSCSFRIALTDGRSTDRGLGTEATRLIVGHAFDTVGVHRVELEVYTFNPRARHVYMKVGFMHEGTKRHALRWDGEWVDVHIMAMLATDWAATRPTPPLSGRPAR
jgi:RimJ/RimL family protein N-acetyltransferase